MTKPKKRKVGQGMKARAIPVENKPAVSADAGQPVDALEPETGGKVGVETSNTLEAEKLQNLESTKGAEKPLSVAQVEPKMMRTNLEDLMRDSVDAMRTAFDQEEAPLCKLCGKRWEWNAALESFEHDDNCLGLRRATAEDLERLKEANPLLTVNRPSIAEIEDLIQRRGSENVSLEPNGEVVVAPALGQQADGTYKMVVTIAEGYIDPIKEVAAGDRITEEEWVSTRLQEIMDTWWQRAESR